MNCADIEELVQRRLDGAPVDVPADEPHLSGCATCRQLWSACGQLEDGLQKITPPSVPAGLNQRVVARYLREQRQARRQLYIGITALAASTVLVAFLLRPWAAPLDVAPVEPQPVVKVDDKPEGTMQENVGEAGEALVAIVTRTAGETVGQGTLLMPDAVAIANPMTDNWGETLVPPAEPLREAGRGVSTGLEPVTSSARRAVNLFWRDLPPVNLE